MGLLEADQGLRQGVHDRGRGEGEELLLELRASERRDVEDLARMGLVEVEALGGSKFLADGRLVLFEPDPWKRGDVRSPEVMAEARFEDEQARVEADDESGRGGA